MTAEALKFVGISDEISDARTISKCPNDLPELFHLRGGHCAKEKDMDRQEANLAALGSSIRELLVFECAAAEDLRLAREEFLQRVAIRNARPLAHRPRWPLLLSAAAVAAGAIALMNWTRAPITFRVGASAIAGRPGDLVQAATVPAPLRFSDGSSLLLHEQGRLRVLDTNRSGARVLVEDGTVDVDVAHAAPGKKQWKVEAGPFVVSVTGTKFALSYSASDETLSLVMKEGHVTLSATCLDGPTHATAGERLDVSCRPQPPSPATPAPAMAAPPAVAPTSTVALPGAAEERSRARWRELLAAGQLRDGLSAAEQFGWMRVCQSASSKELLALADAARLFEHPARAISALRALRQRFPSAAEASVAAFTLGRIAFEHQRDYETAAGWFASYLREQPRGPLMGDAFGRLMESKLAAGDQAGAHLDAEQYLRRFPEGPYASEARGIVAR